MLKILQSEKREPYSGEKLWADLKAGVIAFASIVPGGMALGVVSGMGPVAGLHCLVVVGLVAACCGGARILVCGPSLAISVMVASILTDTGGDLARLAVITVMAGVMQMLFGLCGIGRFAAYLPQVVMTAFLSGIGLLIVWRRSVKIISSGMDDIAIVGVSLAVMLLWPAKIEKYVPGPLAGIASGSVLSLFLPGAMRLGEVPTGLPVPVLSLPSLDVVADALGPAALLALFSSGYTLMLAVTTDTYTGGQHNPNRQLVSLGIANVAAGFAGTMPGAASLTTFSVIRFGGRTAMAGVIELLLVVLVLVFLGPYVSWLPIAAVSAVILRVGLSLTEWRFLLKLFTIRSEYAAVLLLIIGLAMLVNPFVTLIFGVIAASVINASHLEQLELDNVVSVPLLDSVFVDPNNVKDPFGARAGLLEFHGAFTVASWRKLAHIIGNDLQEHDVVIVDLTTLTHMDDSAAYLIALLVDRARRHDTEVIFVGIPKKVREVFHAFDVLRHVPAERIVDTRNEARELAASLMN